MNDENELGLSWGILEDHMHGGPHAWWTMCMTRCAQIKMIEFSAKVCYTRRESRQPRDDRFFLKLPKRTAHERIDRRGREDN